jgi:hypothetical protein
MVWGIGIFMCLVAGYLASLLIAVFSGDEWTSEDSPLFVIINVFWPIVVAGFMLYSVYWTGKKLMGANSPGELLLKFYGAERKKVETPEALS